MKAKRKHLFVAAFCIVLGCADAVNADMPSEWRYIQNFAITNAGLVKISLPVDTISAARPSLEDLRLCDDTGNELPFFISRPLPSPKAVQSAKSFQTTLSPTATVVTLETGLAQLVDGVSLETPAMNFIKAVRVEGSKDQANWQPLVEGAPIFRQFNGASQLHVVFPVGRWPWLRLIIDDRRSQPVPFTGARVFAADAEAAPVELQTVAITERTENPGETRLTLNLGAANLDISSVKIETDEPLFTRPVTVAVPEVTEDAVHEQIIGQGMIYRVAIEGRPPSAELSVPLHMRVHSRELVLLIRNEDSPPLGITAVRVERRPLYLIFMARQAGTFHLLTGNKACAAPRYDLASLNVDSKNLPVTQSRISSPADNPDYHAPEALAGIEVTGAPLDTSAWKYRKLLQFTNNGAEQAELDLDVLTHAQASLADLRILRGTNQIPYLIQRTSINRSVELPFVSANDPKRPKLSRWQIKLPKANLPLTRLTCVVSTPLFQRAMVISEEETDERGAKYNRELGSATWTQTPGSKTKEFVLPLSGAPQTDTLILETENGDNPPIEPKQFTAFYPATRVLFKAGRNDRLMLYYGNSDVPPPSYDLTLVAGELLTADKSTASLGAEEVLRKPGWVERGGALPASGGILFWGILAVVVIGLLAVISRLLPKEPVA